MAAKLIHLHNTTPGVAPTTLELGRIAINHADGKVYISNAAGTAVLTLFAGADGTVKSVNSVSPVAGNVTLTPANLGASTIGATIFGAADAAAVRNAIGATTVGTNVFTATTQANARTALGAGTTGASIFQAATPDDAQSAAGGTTVGKAVFTAVDEAGARTAIGAVSSALVGAANGLATLDASGKVPLIQLPDSVLGGVVYKGTYDASTNTPAIPTAGSGNKGWYYVTNVPGTITPPGQATPLDLGNGDWIISDGTMWSKVDAQDVVSSVAGKTGAVVLAAADITSGVFSANRLGANTGNNRVLTTDASGNSIYVTVVPTINLPTATAAALGLAQAGTGLSVSAGVFSVDTTVLTMDEGTYS